MQKHTLHTLHSLHTLQDLGLQLQIDFKELRRRIRGVTNPQTLCDFLLLLEGAYCRAGEGLPKGEQAHVCEVVWCCVWGGGAWVSLQGKRAASLLLYANCCRAPGGCVGV
jgi:hypothetical protein